ncbi:MAG: hypothetical protein PHV63_04625 [Candidatus Daviesbacteria bacterium]|nr:hypothetical protein [Candidatus Daviesbacteria bacterium]
MIKPNDLGKITPVAENCQKINIDDLIRQANKEIKHRILQSQIEVMGFELSLSTSRTRFNGERYWFLCPICTSRVGTIYKSPLNNQIGCRGCLKIQYRKQRFKGMVEGAKL